MHQGKGVRCYGYLDNTGDYARCTREERAGTLPINTDGTYSHLLHGSCNCGVTHGQDTGYVRQHSYTIYDLIGAPQAEHVRRDRADGSKEMSWRRNGHSGLDGLSPTDMLYGIEHLKDADPGTMAVLVEGEKAADALRAANVRIPLGMVCGAPNAPSVDAFRPLAGRTLAIWPDNDDKGYQAAEKARTNALEAGVASVLLVQWNEAGPKDDAADALAVGGIELVRSLVGSAAPFPDTLITPDVWPTEDPLPESPWPTISDDAFYGLGGSIAKLVTDESEADPIAVLGQFLTLFGVAIGFGPYYEVGATKHSPRIFTAIVGQSSKARKGTSWEPVESIVCRVDESMKERILEGIGSGEQVVHEVRDERWELKGGKEILVDQGVADKRLLVLEVELSRLLTAAGRDGSTISQIIRSAYDGRPLANRVKTNKAIATIHHIGVVGHTTEEELRGRLTEDQIRNGFANRFLWLSSRRSKEVPRPKPFRGRMVDEVVETVNAAFAKAKGVSCMSFSPESEVLWDSWYHDLSSDRYGIIGALTDRAESIVLRLSLIYALTDGVGVVKPDHLRAARALWDYSALSVQHIWGQTTGDTVADKILSELRHGALTRQAISNDIFNRNLSGLVLQKSIDMLVNRRLVLVERIKSEGRGRPVEQLRLAQ